MMGNAFEFELHPVLAIFIMAPMGADLVEVYMKHPEVQKLLKSDERFDVCVFENFLADALLVSVNIQTKSILTSIKK